MRRTGWHMVGHGAGKKTVATYFPQPKDRTVWCETLSAMAVAGVGGITDAFYLYPALGSIVHLSSI